MIETIIFITIGAAGLLIIGLVLFIALKKKPQPKVLNNPASTINTPAVEEGIKQESASSDTSAITLSPAYMDELEEVLQKAFANAAQSAASSLEEELRNATQELTRQNGELVSSVKELESTFLTQFKDSMQGAEEGFVESFQKTGEEIAARNQELVSAVTSLESATRDKLQEVLSASLSGLQGELSGAGEELKSEMRQTALSAIQSEVTSFQEALEDAKKETIESLSKIYTDTESRKKELEEELEKEVSTRREKLLNGLDEKVNSVITSFLIENLGDTLDLSQQQEYIFSMLEEHKEELKKQIHGE